MDNIKLWIVEDDPDWLRGLSYYLAKEPDIEVVWSVSVPDELRSKLRQPQETAPDVVLMDIMLDGRPEGIELAEETALATGARVIMLTSMEEKELILRSFQAGAIDYQIKSSYEHLPAAIRQAYSKQSPISAQAAEQLREEFKRLKQLEREFEVKKLQDLITPSELQLLELVDQGFTQPQMAEKRFVTVRTVKNHINHILKKLGLQSSKEAAGKLKELGILKNNNEQDSTN